MNLYWLSWVQPTDDYRPLVYPPNLAIIAWWCSGYCDAGATLVASVVASSEQDAFNAIQKDWPEITEFRFIELRDNLTVSDRFPITEDWERERIYAFHIQHWMNAVIANF